MSTISKAFDALTPEERIALLTTLEFEDPARYSGWDEKDTRYYCLYYEVQSELNSCYRRNGWDSGAKIIAHPTAAPRPNKAAKSTSPMRDEIAKGIKDFRITISRG